MYALQERSKNCDKLLLAASLRPSDLPQWTTWLTLDESAW